MNKKEGKCSFVYSKKHTVPVLSLESVSPFSSRRGWMGGPYGLDAAALKSFCADALML